MKKFSLYFIIIFIIVLSLFYLNSKSSNYIGINYSIEEEKISNFKKLTYFYQRHLNYKNLVKQINQDSKNEKEKIINTSLWVYKNIKKDFKDEDVVDNHPWTVVERRIGKPDQFSDILSVLLIHDDIDSFFYIPKEINSRHSFTFFKHNNKWSIIDPYYGIYFINNKNSFYTLDQNKNTEWLMWHLIFGKVTPENFNKIFFDKNFKNVQELNIYYHNLLAILPSSETINNTNIYERGGRSYIQKPIHRIIYQIRKILISLK